MTPSESGPAPESTDPILVTRAGRILTATLNRPEKKNALDYAAWMRLDAVLQEAAADDTVRVVVVTGMGGNFCAGAELNSGESDRHPFQQMRRISSVALTLHDMPKPTIAKVDGVAVGAGLSLALGCDLVAAASSARLCLMFARRGLSLDLGGSWLLPRLIGLQQAKRLALLAEFIDLEEALRMGLVTWVKRPDELDEFVDGVAERLAAGPPIALAQSKSLLNEGAQLPLRAAVENECRALAINCATEDVSAALRSFAAKTDPEFTGRWAIG